jgi:hypothetical protein
VSRALRLSSAVYRSLIHVCPRELRKDFGLEMTLLFGDCLRDAWLESGVSGVTRIWFDELREFLRIGFSNAGAAQGVAAALLSSGLSAICLGGELALARSHLPQSIHTPALAEAIMAVVVLPSLTAAIVSFTAIRISSPRLAVPLLTSPMFRDANPERL